MTFDDVINDIEKMVGLELESIKKGANITLAGVDRGSSRVELISSSGQNKSRPFSEFRKIWDKLCSSPAAHVDSVLAGSGSSRNQPETIMANLPYIEWFFLERKKHLTLMKAPSHDYGTLLEMDGITAIDIKDKLNRNDNASAEVIVITEDILSTAGVFEKVMGLPLKPLSAGVYELYNDKARFIIVSKKSINENVGVGTYIVVSGKGFLGTGRAFTINQKKYTVVSECGVNLLVSS